MSVHMLITLHTRKISSHSVSKRRPLWLVMMDDSAPTHKKRKLVKTYKIVLPQKTDWLLMYAGRPTPQNDKKLEYIDSHKTSKKYHAK